MCKIAISPACGVPCRRGWPPDATGAPSARGGETEQCRSNSAVGCNASDHVLNLCQSTGSSDSKSTDSPVSNPALASAPGRYASALFSLARETDSLDAVSRDLETLAAALQASSELRFALGSPAFRQEQKQRALAAVCTRISAHRLTRNCIGVLARHGRIAMLAAVAARFQDLLAARRQEQRVELTSAHPLSPQHQERIRNLLEQATGGSIRLSCGTDANLLTGLKLRLGSLLIDCSLQTKLTNLAVAMKETK